MEVDDAAPAAYSWETFERSWEAVREAPDGSLRSAAEAPRPLKITDSMFDKVHPCQMAALEAEAAKEAGALPVVQPNDPTHSLMFKGSASDRAEAQIAYAERLKAADDARHAERKRAALEKVAERKRERAAAGQGLQSKRRAAEGEDGALEA